MAFPDNLDGIDTNISQAELAEVMRAVDSKEVTWDPRTTSVAGDSSGGNFDYKGARYQLNEIREMVVSLYLIRDEQQALVF